MLAISVGLFVVLVIAGLLLVNDFRANGPNAINLTGGAFLGVSSLGLTVSHYVNYGAALPFINESGMVVYMGQSWIYAYQVSAHIVFVVTLIIFLTFRNRRLRLSIPGGGILTENGWLNLLYLVAAIGYARYFIFGPGFETLLNTNLFYSSAAEAVAARTVAKGNFFGQGAYMAALVSKAILPSIFAAKILLMNRYSALASRFIYFSTLVLFVTLSGLYAFQTREKAPLIAVFLTYGLLHYCYLYRLGDLRGRPFRFNLKKVLKFGGALFGIAVVLYQVVFGLSAIQAILAAPVRIFLVPTATEANYFYVFPSIIDYRGIVESLYIRLYYPVDTEAVSIYDVSVAATGNQFSANASFLAVGWSGAGFLGVLFASLSICFMARIHDALFVSTDRVGRLLGLALLVPSIVVLNSGSVLDFVGSGGLLSAVFLTLLTRNRLGRVRPVRTTRIRHLR